MRPRKPANRALPVNLYKNGRYYQYRHPQTGRYHGMGTDRAAAIRAAHQLNARLFEPISLTERVLGTQRQAPGAESSPLFSVWLDTYSSILDERQLAPISRYQRGRQLLTLREALGSLPLATITTRHIAEFLDTRPPRMANTLRSVLNDCFNEAIAKGLLAANPVTVTKNRRISTQRQRLDLDAFHQIREHCPSHIQTALDLALITLQRREDILSFTWSDLRGGVLEVRQQKTGTRLRITVTEPLKRVIDACRTGIDTPWLVHYHRPVPRASIRAGDPVNKDRLTKAFQEARDALGLYADLAPGARPSFHEIRSLGARLYEARGMDPQTLLGHKTRQMTEVYLDSRREEWLIATPSVDVLSS